MTLQSVRERLVLVLLALLPFHAFLVTVLTKMIAGPNHAPLAALAIWKEALLVVILVMTCLEILKKRPLKRFDAFDAIILALGVVSLGLFIADHQSFAVFALGFKYDLLPLIAFLILRRVPWSDQFRKMLVRVLVAVGCIVAFYSILAEFLPLRFFVWLGYSDLHSLYVANGPLAAFQELEGGMLRRAQSFMSGPNQLGLWLLIPLGVLLGQSNALEAKKWKRFARMAIILLALLHTFSRAAWIAAAAMMVVTFVRSTSALHCRKLWVAILGFALCFGIAVAAMFPLVFFRFQSSSDHIRKPVEAIRMIIDHPLGLGLGTAGPASNRFSDTCVQLPSGSDSSWAKDRQNLCVFVDGTQMQPLGRTCSCPLLTENWYLQIGVELGVVGFLLYIALTVLILLRLKQGLKAHSSKLIAFLPFLGFSIAALFLHAFEDSAVAYTVWILTSIVLLL